MHNNLGRALLHAGRTDEVIVRFRQALVATPSYLPTPMNLAKAYAQSERTDEAISQLREPLHIKPRDPDIDAALGDLLPAQARIDAAIQEYRSALPVGPITIGPSLALTPPSADTRQPANRDNRTVRRWRMCPPQNTETAAPASRGGLRNPLNTCLSRQPP